MIDRESLEETDDDGNTEAIELMLWLVHVFFLSCTLSTAIISMHELLGRLSPGQFIFSLLNETFITQVCSLKNNECCCFGKACINNKPGEAKHERKTRALVKAIWAHRGGGGGVTGTGVRLRN